MSNSKCKINKNINKNSRKTIDYMLVIIYIHTHIDSLLIETSGFILCITFTNNLH